MIVPTAGEPPATPWRAVAIDQLAQQLLDSAGPRVGGGVHFQPPAWDTHDRCGQIEVPSSVQVLILEGVGAARRSLVDFVDFVSIWVQSDHQTAEERGIKRDTASGVNGNEAESIAFRHDWIAQEMPFFEDEKPWERVSVIAAGSSAETPGPASVLIAPPAVRSWQRTGP